MAKIKGAGDSATCSYGKARNRQAVLYLIGYGFRYRRRERIPHLAICRRFATDKLPIVRKSLKARYHPDG
jgi:hypothetical protein